MTINEDLMVTAELCGTPDLSTAAARLFAEELEGYPEDAIHGALARCRRELTGRLTPAAVLERLDDGRPGAEEAWSMLPKDENDTAVITDDMREAMGAGLALLPDEVAARMAFVEAYRRVVREARAERKPVAWFISLGHDKSRRSGPLLDAMRQGRITAEQARQASGAVAAVIGDAKQIEGAIAEPVEKGAIMALLAKAMPGGKIPEPRRERAEPIPVGLPPRVEE